MANSRNNDFRDPQIDALFEDVTALLRRHIQPGQKVVVGFSGGRDSVALLHLLQQLRSYRAFDLAACHVNHQLSPNALTWQSFCAAYCVEHGIPLQIVEVKVPRGSADGLESAARTARYAAFKALQADWLMLGQHQADQAETVLFNLVRGCGVRGAAGIPSIRLLRAGLLLMRPMLNCRREQIERYLSAQGLSWVEDESNADLRFTRNYLRHQVIPVLRVRFPAVEQSLAAAAARFSEAQQLLDELAVQDLSSSSIHFPLALVVLQRLSEPRARNVLRYMLQQSGVRTPSESRLTEALRQMLEARADRHPSVTLDGCRLFRHRGYLYLESVAVSSSLSTTDE